MNIEIIVLDKQNIERLVGFAKPIWEEHYTPIIGEKQVAYMLDKFQSEQAVESQINEGYQYFEVYLDEQLVGYFSIQPRNESSLFISKFYLAKQARGKKLGSTMLEYIHNLAKKGKRKTIDLTVNKYNPTYNVYLKLGFNNIGSVEMDIGNGYIMDDFLMQKNI